MATPRIDIVVFDLGGVLVEIARDWREAHSLAGLGLGHPGLASAAFHEHGPKLADAHQRGEMTPPEWARAISQACGGAYSEAEAISILDAWTIREYPGIVNVIDAIHDAGLGTAVLSNTNARHWELLGVTGGDFRNYPTLQRIGQLHASHLLGAIKPDREIFEAFTGAAGLGRARVLFFDDLSPNVTAARRYGWAARRINHLGDPAAQMMAALRQHRIVD